MKIIGLTGGVGSGKSTIAKIMVEQFPVYAIYTDEIARDQMKKDGVSYMEVIKEFGTSILDNDGEINRGKLAAIVFADEIKLLKLNQLTHPNVQKEVKRIINQIKKENRYQAVLIETALLLEAGYDTFCDEIWYVYASKDHRRERLIKSRNYSEEKIEDLFKKQKTEEEFQNYSTVTIDNSDGITREGLLNQISYFLCR